MNGRLMESQTKQIFRDKLSGYQHLKDKTGGSCNLNNKSGSLQHPIDNIP